MVIRLISYFLVLLLLCEGLVVTAVSWSFYESASSSLNLLKYTSDNKARDILATVARVAETKMTNEGFNDMNDFFSRLIKQSEKDLDKFTIKEVFMISSDGVVLSHSNPAEVAADLSQRTASQKYNKPYYMRALRMRKGQLPTPQTFGQEYKGDNSFVGNYLMKLFPDLKYQTVLLSAPIYHSEKLETIGSIHLIYNRGNVLFYIESQREIYFWILANSLAMGLVATVFLWAVYMIFLFGSYRQGGRNVAKVADPPSSKTLTKIQTVVEKQEQTLRDYLSPIKLDTSSTQVKMDALIDKKPAPVHPENISQPEVTKVQQVPNNTPIQLNTREQNNGSNTTKQDIKPIVPPTTKPNPPINPVTPNNKANATEALDAIYLD